MAAAFTKRAILITGATGKQGGATINALLNAGALSSYHILALTRNQSSPSAKNLASRGVKLVSGDLGNVPDVFRKAKRVAGGPIWGVFSVQVSLSNQINSSIRACFFKQIDSCTVDSHGERSFCGNRGNPRQGFGGRGARQ